MPKSRKRKNLNKVNYQDHNPNKTKGPLPIVSDYPIYIYKRVPTYETQTFHDGNYVIQNDDGTESRLARIIKRKVQTGHEMVLIKKIPAGTVIRYAQRPRRRFKKRLV